MPHTHTQQSASAYHTAGGDKSLGSGGRQLFFVGAGGSEPAEAQLIRRTFCPNNVAHSIQFHQTSVHVLMEKGWPHLPVWGRTFLIPLRQFHRHSASVLLLTNAVSQIQGHTYIRQRGVLPAPSLVSAVMATACVSCMTLPWDVGTPLFTM